MIYFAYASVILHNYQIISFSRPDLFYFLLDIFFIYISNVIPLPGFPSENLLYPPHFPCTPTNPLLLPGPGIPIHRSIDRAFTKPFPSDIVPLGGPSPKLPQDCLNNATN